MVAEGTGRTRRTVVDGQGRQKVERRTSSSNIAETDNFMSGRKPILVFSEAGGTGRSYHADLGCPTAHKRRIHFLLEPGWRADIAIQGLGRTHRTYQSMRSEEHTSELQSLMRISYAVFCLKKKQKKKQTK